jgi:multidrug resistance efflux pump
MRVCSLDAAELRARVNAVKEIIIRIDDELYRRAKERVDNLEAALNEQVTGYLKTLNGDDQRIDAARAQMKELFNATKGSA